MTATAHDADFGEGLTKGLADSSGIGLIHTDDSFQKEHHLTRSTEIDKSPDAADAGTDLESLIRKAQVILLNRYCIIFPFIHFLTEPSF